jgi:uncharacterized protein (DUF1330 family)
MAAYIIASYDVTDPNGFLAYQASVIPILLKHGAEVLVADPAGAPLEGEPGRMTVVLKFASRQHALDWYNDPDYAPVRQLRLDATTNGRMSLTDEFRMPF